MSNRHLLPADFVKILGTVFFFSAEHCEKRGRRSLTPVPPLTSDNDLDLNAHSLNPLKQHEDLFAQNSEFFHWLAVCDLRTQGANNRQHGCLPSSPISEPKHQDITHIGDWILIADIFNFFFFSPLRPPQQHLKMMRLLFLCLLLLPAAAGMFSSLWWFQVINI